MESNDFRPYSRLELLINQRNKVLDQIIEAEIKLDEIPMVLIKKKAKDPEKINSEKTLKIVRESLRRMRIRLGIIDTHISIERKAEKREKDKNSN